jgi:hypothetical protein
MPVGGGGGTFSLKLEKIALCSRRRCIPVDLLLVTFRPGEAPAVCCGSEICEPRRRPRFDQPRQPTLSGRLAPFGIVAAWFLET